MNKKGTESKNRVDYLHCKELLSQGKDAEYILNYLKKAGYSMAQSAFFLVQLGVGDSYVAGKIVDKSKVWRE